MFLWETDSEIDKSIQAVDAAMNTSATLLLSLGRNGTDQVLMDWVEVSYLSWCTIDLALSSVPGARESWHWDLRAPGPLLNTTSYRVV